MNLLFQYKYSASSLVVPLFVFFLQLQNIFACKYVLVTAIFMKSGADNATSIQPSICVSSVDEIQKVATDVAPQT